MIHRAAAEAERKNDVLARRLEELRSYLARRISECRRVEEKFCKHQIGKHYPQVPVEAWTERIALQNVQRILGWDELTPPAAREGGGK